MPEGFRGAHDVATEVAVDLAVDLAIDVAVDRVEHIWWGDHYLETGDRGRFKVGPLTVWVARLASEWRLATLNSGDRDDAEVDISSPLAADEAIDLPSSASIERLVENIPGGGLRLLPALADRLVLNRPEGVFRVLAGAEVKFYVSTPLWFRLESLDLPRVLFEQAIVRPSDTWFGPSTRHGEVAYSSRTPACLDLTELPMLPFRAITPVLIRNRADDDLTLQRLALPAPSLTLYVDRARPQLGLWTSAVILERRSDRDLAHVEVQASPPRDLQQGEVVAGPRSALSRSVWVRALSAILS